MAVTVSKQVAAREKVAEVIGSSVEIHAPMMIEALGRELFPEGVPDDVNLEKLVEALGNSLRRHTGVMHEADVALAAEVADDQPKRDARDEKLTRLRLEVQDGRDAINGTYGNGLAETYGFKGEVPVAGDVLRNFAATIITLLQRTPFSGSPKRGRGAMDAVTLAATLQELVDDYIATLGEVSQEEREYQIALGARDAAVTQWSRVYRGVAGVLSSLFVLAGSEDLAERVRPTARRGAGIAEPTVEGGE